MGSRVALQTKVWLYDICVKPIALYASETCTVTQSGSDRIDAFNQWCLRLISGVRWSDHITNMDILSSQQLLNKIVSRRRLTLFRHVDWIMLLRDSSRALVARMPRSWKRLKGSPCWKSTMAKDLTPLNISCHTTLNPLTAVSRGSGYKFFVTLHHEPAIRIEHYMQNGADSRRPG